MAIPKPEDGVPFPPYDPEQWPEARGFARVFTRDPEIQSRYVKILLGMRQEQREYVKDENVVQAIDVVLKAFLNKYPECLMHHTQAELDADTLSHEIGHYKPEERMLWLLESADILKEGFPRG